jgi:hypothetical protein
MTDSTHPFEAVSSHSLLVVSGQAKGTVIPIPRGELLLGREADQDGELGGDPLLSRRHARITSDEDGQITLEDLGSTNGTFLNGARMSGRQRVHTGDVIQMGGSRLQVVDAAAPATAGDDAARAADADDDPLSSAWGMEEADDADTPAGPALSPAGPPPGAAAMGRPRGGPRPAASRRGRATVEGQIRGIQQRAESLGEGATNTVWTFRLERYDRDGNRLPPIPVQLRGLRFEGFVSEGDDVRATGEWKDGTLVTERVENLTTHATVKARSYRNLKVASLIFFLLFVVALILVAVAANRESNQFNQQFCEDAQRNGFTMPGC